MPNKSKMIEEDPEYGVDSRYTSEEERITDSVALMEARLQRMETVSKDQITRARLMQQIFKNKG